MPKGLPSAAQLMGQEITFFSIDTNLIRAVGFRFEEGALNQLQRQLPGWLKLQLTEVAEREIRAQRMAPVTEAIQQFQGAAGKIGRSTGLDLAPIERAFADMKVASSTEAIFDRQLHAFVQRLRGSVLPIAGSGLAEAMFSRYFGEEPPFEHRKDKKFEFPDAAALLVLEMHARAHKTLGILVSEDGGWKDFAEKSDLLYCVKSIDEFAALFASEGPNAESVKQKIRAAAEDENSKLRASLVDELRRHIGNSEWAVGDLYSGSAHRLEGEAYSAELIDYSVDLSDVEVWFVEHDPSMCVVELTVSAKARVDISVEFFAWDSIDREEVGIGSNEFSADADLDVTVFLTCSGDLLADPPTAWDVDIEIAAGEYSVDVGEVNPDFSDSR
ncbi:MAG: DUF4935 domain-containing protein [Xanthomonadaceae bacterium]|nr:DUF4935 domain-containing protein [Xanthomonadaceae bacterium]